MCECVVWCFSLCEDKLKISRLREQSEKILAVLTSSKGCLRIKTLFKKTLVKVLHEKALSCFSFIATGEFKGVFTLGTITPLPFPSLAHFHVSNVVLCPSMFAYAHNLIQQVAQCT